MKKRKTPSPADSLRRLVGRIRRLTKQMHGQIEWHRDQALMLRTRNLTGDHRYASDQDDIADSLLHFATKLDAIAPNGDLSNGGHL